MMKGGMGRLHGDSPIGFKPVSESALETSISSGILEMAYQVRHH